MRISSLIQCRCTFCKKTFQVYKYRAETAKYCSRSCYARAQKGIYKRNVNLSPSPVLSYILGVIFGDGCIYYNDKRQSWGVRLDAKDKGFVEEFREALKLLDLRPRFYTREYRYGKHNFTRKLYYTVADTKALAEFIKKIKTAITELEEIVKPYPREFLRGFFQSEGSFDRGRWTLSISNNNAFLLSICQKALNSLTFSSKVYLSNKGNNHSLCLYGRINCIECLKMLNEACVIPKNTDIDTSSEKIQRSLTEIYEKPKRVKLNHKQNEIVELYNQGYSISKIVAEYKVLSETIYSLLRQAGVPIRSKSEIMSIVRKEMLQDPIFKAKELTKILKNGKPWNIGVPATGKQLDGLRKGWGWNKGLTKKVAGVK